MTEDVNRVIPLSSIPNVGVSISTAGCDITCCHAHRSYIISMVKGKEPATYRMVSSLMSKAGQSSVLMDWKVPH
jgi:uncharacterized radical SAM superfamily protein